VQPTPKGVLPNPGAPSLPGQPCTTGQGLQEQAHEGRCTRCLWPAALLPSLLPLPAAPMDTQATATGDDNIRHPGAALQSFNLIKGAIP
jgi:hypothetical protein